MVTRLCLIWRPQSTLRDVSRCVRLSSWRCTIFTIVLRSTHQCQVFHLWCVYLWFTLMGSFSVFSGVCKVRDLSSDLPVAKRIKRFYSESNFLSANASGQIHTYYQRMFPFVSNPFASFYVYFQRALYNDMPHQCFFSCLRESDQAFISRSGWVYRPGNSVYLPSDDILVLPPAPWFVLRRNDSFHGEDFSYFLILPYEHYI